MRYAWWLVLVVACKDKPVPTPPAPLVVDAGHHTVTMIVERCLPVGYGEHCGGMIDGRPVSLQACVGSEGIGELTHRLESVPIPGQDGGRPIAIVLETKSIGVLDAAYSSDYCGGLLFEDTKEQLHIVALR
jgi:hypothetical protein